MKITPNPESISLDEIGLSKYLPMLVRGRIGSRRSIEALVKAQDSEIGEIKFKFSLGDAHSARVAPKTGIKMLTQDNVVCLKRSLIFTSSSIHMGQQNQATNVSIPLFSTLVKFLTWFEKSEQSIVDWSDRTGMIDFTAYPGATARDQAAGNTDANGRDRVYGLIVRQMEHMNVGVLINHTGNHFTVLFKDFADYMITHHIAEKA